MTLQSVNIHTQHISRVQFLKKILSPLVILSLEKTMITMVISELKSVSRLKIFFRNWTLVLVMFQNTKRAWYNILFKSKSSKHKTCKTSYQPDDYVIKCMSRRQRRFLAQFRAGLLPLHIEIARWRGSPLESICIQHVKKMSLLCSLLPAPGMQQDSILHQPEEKE